MTTATTSKSTTSKPPFSKRNKTSNNTNLRAMWGNTFSGNFIDPTTFDIERSLKEAPPFQADGMRWVERKVIEIKEDAVVDTDYQARHKGTSSDHRALLQNSFENNGWLYDQFPVLSIWDAKVKKYIVHDGFTRINALGALNCKFVVTDVYVALNPLALEIAKLKLNQVHTPKKGSDAGDIVNAAINCINKKCLASDVDSIKRFVNETASHLSPKRRRIILNNIVNQQTSSKYRVYLVKGIGDHNVADVAKTEFNIPYGGDANYDDTGYFGYITTEKTARMTISNSVKLLKQVLDDMRIGSGKYSHLTELPEVKIFAYMETPGMSDLRTQRQAWLHSFKETLDSLRIFCEYMTDSKSKKKFPITFGGFLPQLIDADPTKNGNKKETAIVDENGHPFDWKNG